MCDGYAMFKALFTFVQNHLLRVVVFFFDFFVFHAIILRSWHIHIKAFLLPPGRRQADEAGLSALLLYLEPT
jgi:hypothetical protein